MSNTKKDDYKRKVNSHDNEGRLHRLSLLSSLFRRYFSGEASEKEKQIIDAWDARSAWERNRRKTDDNKMNAAVDELWSKISRQLQIEKSRPSFPVRLRSLGRYAAVITAAIIMVGAAFYLVQHTSLFQTEQLTAETNIHVETSDKLMKRIQFPDGTHVFLNRNSKLTYQPDRFNKELREVWLEGEAFFDVARNPAKPFIVHNGELQTVVKGTSFNIKSYAGITRSVISVRSGKVEVRNSGKLLDMLVENRQIVYSKDDGSFVTEEKAWEDSSGWMDGRLVLNHADISELKLRIRQHFNTELLVRDDALSGIALKSSFARGTPLQVVLESLSLLYGINYKFTSERQVEIYR